MGKGYQRSRAWCAGAPRSWCGARTTREAKAARPRAGSIRAGTVGGGARALAKLMKEGLGDHILLLRLFQVLDAVYVAPLQGLLRNSHDSKAASN